MSQKCHKCLLGQKCIMYLDKNPLSHLQSAKLHAIVSLWLLNSLLLSILSDTGQAGVIKMLMPF